MLNLLLTILLDYQHYESPLEAGLKGIFGAFIFGIFMLIRAIFRSIFGSKKNDEDDKNDKNNYR